METKTSSRDLARLNERVRTGLNAENKTYYENLSLYMHAKMLIRDRYRAEELLLEVLKDIIEAQKNGMSAEDYFGKNPKQIADDMLEQLPISLPSFLKTTFYGLGIWGLTGSYMSIVLLQSTHYHQFILDIGQLFVIGILFILTVYGFIWLLGFSVYRYKSRLLKVLFTLLMLAVTLGGIALIKYFNLFATSLKVHLNFIEALLVLIAYLVITTIMNINNIRKEGRKIPIIPVIGIVVMIVLGIGLLVSAPFFSTNTGIVVLVTIEAALAYLFFVRKWKK